MQSIEIKSLSMLLSARKVADFAHAEGACNLKIPPRDLYQHMGAVLADSVLQAGLNYKSVVVPRIQRIIHLYPHASCGDILLKIVTSGQTAEFLDWRHAVKIARFNSIVLALNKNQITTIDNLKSKLLEESFCLHLQEISGVGPKTVDYMGCLIGIDSIAVDRHVKNFANRAGVECLDYKKLKYIFSAAADLLDLPRRDFDAWLWRHQANKSKLQGELPF